jgi:hypothetical protein
LLDVVLARILAGGAEFAKLLADLGVFEVDALDLVIGAAAFDGGPFDDAGGGGAERITHIGLLEDFLGASAGAAWPPAFAPMILLVGIICDSFPKHSGQRTRQNSDRNVAPKRNMTKTINASDAALAPNQERKTITTEAVHHISWRGAHEVGQDICDAEGKKAAKEYYYESLHVRKRNQRPSCGTPGL